MPPWESSPPPTISRSRSTPAVSPPLPIGIGHALVAGAPPHHHDDPFDRMLIAQATIEGLTVVSRDGRFAAYGVRLLTA